MLRQDRPRPVRAVRSAPPAAAAAPEAVARPAGPGADAFYEALRLWRLAEARGQSIPPYVIFHDSVLRDIAAARPTTLEELGAIKGVGASKLERYGTRVLGVLGSAVPDGLIRRG